MNYVKIWLFFIGLLAEVYGVCQKSLLSELTYQVFSNNLEWPCISTKNIFVQTGRYKPKNIIATRVQIYKDTAIIVMPRYKQGVPFTVGRICLKTFNKCNPIVSPFSCFPIHEEGNPDAIQNAVDIFLDAQDILWVLDVGVVNTLEQPVRRGPPRVWAFDVKTGKLLKVIDLSGLVCTISRLQYLAAEYAEDGRAYLYISDATTRSIVVFDVALNRGYRVVLPEAVTLDCGRRDVLYLALVRKLDNSVYLYFTYLSGKRLFAIRTSCLRTGSALGTITDIGVKPTKFVVLGTDNGSNLFIRFKGDSNILMWNTQTCFKETNFIPVQTGGDCRLATHVVPGYKNLMWVLESNFQDYLLGTTGCVGANVQLHPLINVCDEC
ncbi:dopaminechrome tautomerase-like [Lycorma delicatula]|uniref:dopaminechrome tautomerase-like n=1 Tax=Lycorma delicatula TaxID=130591 RepID=UPI003F511F9F